MPDQPLSTRNRPQSPNHPVRLKARERDREALEMRMAGMTFQAIGDALGFSQQAAQKAVTRSLEITKADISEKADELRTIEAARLERLTEILHPLVEQGDLRAIDRYLRTRESYRRLLALDLEPEKVSDAVEITVIDGRPPWLRGDVIDGTAVDVPQLSDGSGGDE